MVTIIAFTIELLLILVNCQKIYVQDSDEKNVLQNNLWKIFGAISRAKENIPLDVRRFSNDNEQIKYFYDTLTNTVDVAKFKKWLRQNAAGNVEETPEDDAKAELVGLVENELLNALSKKSSALLDKTYVQKKGRNDFLVIQSDLRDPFVTIVPNDIYYNAEKKCINWLDDCNQKGLRDRLLQKISGPYK